MDEWAVSDSETVFAGEQVTVQRDRVVDPAGETQYVEYIPEMSGAAILPLTADGKVVTITEYRHPIQSEILSIPGGKCADSTEAQRETVKRELEEETGYVAGEVAFLGATHQFSGLVAGTHYYFVGFDCEPGGDQSLDLDESIEIVIRAFGAVEQLVQSGEPTDSRLPISLYLYEQYDSA